MRGKQVVFSDFRGGVNAEAAPYNIQPTQARDARNVVGTLGGSIRKRDGSTAFATPPVELTSLFANAHITISAAQAELNGDGNTSPRWMIASNGPNVYGIRTDGGSVFALATGLPGGTRWEWVRAPVIGGQGPFYGLNGGVAYQWTGQGDNTPAAPWTANVGAVPLGKYIVYHGTRLWVSGVSTDESAVFFSNIGDPRDWGNPANRLRFDPEDNEPITALAPAGPYLLVFKRTKIWLITDLETRANRPVSRNIGCIAPRSAVETPRGTLFLSPEHGVVVANHNNTQLLSNNEQVSTPVNKLLANFSDTELSLATAAYFNDHYYLALPSATTPLILDYDLRLGSWWIHSLNVNHMAVRHTLDGVPQLYAAMRSIAAVRRLFVPGATTDVGVNYSAYWSGPFHTFGRPAVRKRCRELQIDGTGTVTVALGKDYVEPSGTAGTGFAGGQLVKDARVHTPGVARSWGVKFSNDTNATFEINAYTMAMQERTD